MIPVSLVTSAEEHAGMRRSSEVSKAVSVNGIACTALSCVIAIHGTINIESGARFRYVVWSDDPQAWLCCATVPKAS